MYIVLVVLHVLASFAIIGIVLLQAGKGADIGSAFGGAGSQAVFGSMGTPTVLGKITGAIAVMFTVTSFTLAMLGGERSGGSVIREPAPASAPAPSNPSAPPAAPGSTSGPGQSAPQPRGAPAQPGAPPAEKSK